MRIHDSIIANYLNDVDPTHYQNHWIFYNIEPEKYLFERPDKSLV